MSSVVNNKVSDAFAGVSSSGGATSYNSLGSIQSLPPAILLQVQNAFSDAIRWAYVALLPFVCIAAVSAFFLREVKIERSAEEERSREQERQKQDAELGQVTNERGEVQRTSHPRIKIVGPIGAVIWCFQAIGDKMGLRK